MGKQKRNRTKFHLSPLSVKEKKRNIQGVNESPSELPLQIAEKVNIFEGLEIDISSLHHKIADDGDDTQSIKSYKSIKSRIGEGKVLPKKDKVKLRRQLLLRKIDTLNQFKKEFKNQRTTKNTNSLDEKITPFLMNLKLNKHSKKTNEQTKLRGTDKASKRKKNTLKNVNLYKQILKKVKLKKDPFTVVQNMAVERGQ